MEEFAIVLAAVENGDPEPYCVLFRYNRVTCAVYQVSENVYSEQDFPKGDYGVALVDKEGNESVVLQIKDGSIVRIAQVFDDSLEGFTGVLERSAAEVILPPIQ